MISFGAVAPGTRTVAIDEIGAPAQRLDHVAGREQRAHAAAELRGDTAQRLRVAVDDGDVGAHAGGDQRRVGAGDAAAEHDHARRRNARHAGKQHAAAAVLLLQAMRADMGRHAAGDLRHRREQRQRALRARHRLIGNRGDARGHQLFGLRAVGREMQVGEQHLPAPELLALDRERLLHLHDQFGAAEYSVGIFHDLGARRAVVGVGEARAKSCSGLDQHLMALFGKLAHRRRHQADAVFVVLDLLRHADDHGDSFFVVCSLSPLGRGSG